ncbi:MAG: hypothetical protein ACKOJB_10430, partial [Chthoniobacterales bacterium]
MHLEISDRQPGELCCLAQRKLSAGKQSQRQFQFGVGSRQVSGLKQPCRQFQSAARSHDGKLKQTPNNRKRPHPAKLP